MDVKVSVIIPVYNTQNYLDKCLESVINQTLKEIEIIIINDGSTDQSLDIIKCYERKYDNIIVINKQNEGQGVARNKALEICKGEYIAFVDSDDYIEPNMFEAMYLKSLEKKLDIVICNYRYVNNNEQEIRNNISVLKEEEVINNIECIKRFLVTETIEGFSWNKLFKRKLFDINNIRYPEGMKYEDIPTVLSLLINATRIGFINNKFYNYVVRKDSTTSTQTIGNITDFIKANCMVGEILEYNGIRNLEKEYEFFYLKKIVNSIYSARKKCGKKEENTEFVKKVLEHVNEISKFRIFLYNNYFKKVEAIKIIIKIYLCERYVNRNNKKLK